jgi:antirestriction protein ArdC
MNVPEIVTNLVIDGLKHGKIAWQKTWVTNGTLKNFISNHKYTGINTLLLNLNMMSNKWTNPLFASFKQITENGYKVNDGAKGNLVVFTKNVSVTKSSTNDNGEEELTEKTLHLLRYYYVFNIEQTNAPIDKYVTIEKSELLPVDKAETLLNNLNPNIVYGTDEACYSPTFDIINLPSLNQFKKVNEFYNVAFHELTHWTGHETRLNRIDMTRYGSDKYAKEELVAEIGSNMACFECGLEATITNNSQAYINGWLEVLKNDSKFIISAASQAQKAFNFLTQKTPVTV